MSKRKLASPERRKQGEQGRIERRKALKIYMASKKKRAGKAQTTKEEVSMSMRTTTVRKRNVLGDSDRNAIIGMIAKQGHERVVDAYFEQGDQVDRSADSKTIRKVELNAQYSFSRRNKERLTRLARTAHSDTSSKPLVAIKEPEPTQAPAQTGPATDVQAVLRALVKALTNTAQPTQAAPPPVERAALPPEGGFAKSYIEHTPSAQRAILCSMHGDYAARLKRDGATQAHRAAWNISYSAWDKKTGQHVSKMAKSASKANRRHISALDIIEEDGNLVDFWETVRETWEI